MRTRITIRGLAILALWAGLNDSSAKALPPAPKAEEMAAVQPKQPRVNVSTPSPSDLARYRVEAFPNAKEPVGYVLLDSNDRPVRRFVAVGTRNYNILSFYLDGQEVYRETDTKGAGKFDQYRWLGSNGSKIGYDLDGNGSIDAWEAISPEEVSKEVFEAMAWNEAARLESLLPRVEELKAMGLPQPEIEKIQARSANAIKRLQTTASQLKLSPKSKWIHLELWTPETTPLDSFGGKSDIVRHRNAGVLVEMGDGKSVEMFQLGELVQYGKAWRLIDGPAPGTPTPPQPGVDALEGGPTPVPEKIRAIVANLQGRKPDDFAGRAGDLEEIVTKMQGDANQTDWIKQLIDVYANWAETGDSAPAGKLAAWKKQIEGYAPKSPLAGFASFRMMALEYSEKLKASDTPAKISEVQKWWRDSLEQFVKDYPRIEETPEALFRLAMASEFTGRTGEEAARQQYAILAKNFPNHQLAAQAQGAIRRLESEGQPFQLTGPNLISQQPMSMAQLQGKVVIVYYWASWYGRLKEEAATLTDLMRKYNSKGLEVITVCMDQTPQQAVQAINATSLPGQHMFQAGGALATAWGVMGPHTFLLGRDGKVINKNAQVPLLADEIEKLMK